MAYPTTIKLFLANGQPDGLRTAEISNWSGLAIAGPRSELSELRARLELKSPGIYFLIGVDENTGDQKIYIGEADNVSDRLGHKSHKDREFWTKVISFISKDNNLTKAHIKYLEGQVINRANELALVTDNGQGSGSSLPESDVADMKQYLDKIFQLLPVLGLNTFEVPESIPLDAKEWIFCSIKGLIAKGRRTSNGFLVAEGSQAVKKHRPSAKSWQIKREELIANKTLTDAGDHYVFARDFEFSSPSAAGATVRGGSTNGLTAWKNKAGQTLKDLDN